MTGGISRAVLLVELGPPTRSLFASHCRTLPALRADAPPGVGTVPAVLRVTRGRSP